MLLRFVLVGICEFISDGAIGEYDQNTWENKAYVGFTELLFLVNEREEGYLNE